MSLNARPMSLLMTEIAVAVSRLADAGLESPRADAELMAAHRHGVSRSALNLVADARLGLQSPPLGTTEGEVTGFGNGNWYWQRQVSAADFPPGLLEISVRVRRNTTGSTASSATSLGATTTTTTSKTATSSSRSHAGGTSAAAGAGARSVESPGASIEGLPVAASAARDIPASYAVRSSPAGPIGRTNSIAGPIA